MDQQQTVDEVMEAATKLVGSLAGALVDAYRRGYNAGEIAAYTAVHKDVS